MMNRLKSARVHLVKFVFVLPLLAVLLLAFRNKEGWNKQVKNDTIPDRRVMLDGLVLHNATIDHLHLISLKEFYRRNPEVKQVAWSDEDELIVYMKNGRKEVYSTEDKDDMKRFVKAYGGVPTIMMPPPPADVFAPFPPMEAPIIIDEFEMGDIEVPDFDIEVPDFEVEVPDMEFEMPDIDIDIDMDLDDDEPVIIGMDDDDEVDVDADVDDDEMLDIQDDLMNKFYERNPQVRAVMWRNDEIIIQKKDRSVETYTLSDKKDMKLFREKYGEPPMAPPAPPPAPKKPRSVDVHDQRSVGTRPVQPGIVVRDKNNQEVTLMADQIVVHGSIPNWKLKPMPADDPVFYVNGKKSTKQNFESLAKANKVFEVEVIAAPETVVKITGEPKYTSLMNLITKENANEPSVRVTTGVRTVETPEEMALRNMMYHGIENPINISAHGIPADELVVTMQGGKITKKNGRFYAVPQSTGNVEIMIYRSTDKGLKLLNKRSFRVRMQPNT